MLKRPRENLRQLRSTTRIHVHVHVCVFMYMYVSFCTCVCIYVYTCICMSCIYLHVHVCTCICWLQIMKTACSVLILLSRWRKVFKVRQHLRQSEAQFPPMGPLTPLHTQVNSMLPAGRGGFRLPLLSQRYTDSCVCLCVGLFT